MKLFYTLKAYNFKTKEEAEKHIIQMRKKGWELKLSFNGETISYIGDGYKYPYEVMYIKY